MVPQKNDLARSEVGAPSRTYRLRVYFRNIGIVQASIAAILFIVGTLAAFFNPDGLASEAGVKMIFSAVVSGAFLLLGLWLVVAYFRYRLIRDGDTIHLVGVLHQSALSMLDVRKLKWSLFPQAGSAVLIGDHMRFRIEFSNFTRDERAEIVAYLREHVADECQTNWPAFEAQFMRSKIVSAQQRRAARRTVSLAMIGFAIVLSAMGLAGFGGHLYVVAALNLAIGMRALWLNLRSENDTVDEV